MKRLLVSLLSLAMFALPLGAVAAPASSAAMPTCAAGDAVVWLNTKSKAYHMAGDSYYGKTKSGKYICQSSATAMGAHLAGGAKSAAAAGPGAVGSTTAAAPMTTGRKHRKKSGMATPCPSSTP